MFLLKTVSTFHQGTKENSKGLLNQSEAPAYMREDSITSGYRRKLSYGACVIRYVTHLSYNTYSISFYCIATN